MAYSIDFRRKILEIKARDVLSFEETALRFGLSKSSVSRWAKRLEPCRTRNKPATKIDPERLIRDVEQHPDAYQHERAERLGCSLRGICEALKRLKISVYELMRIPLIYIDEIDFSGDMPRIFGYAPAGEALDKRCRRINRRQAADDSSF